MFWTNSEGSLMRVFCSPVDLPQCHFETLAWMRLLPWTSCSHRIPHPPASAWAATGRPVAVQQRSMDTCHSPTWTDLPTPLFCRTAVAKVRVKLSQTKSLNLFFNDAWELVERLFCTTLYTNALQFYRTYLQPLPDSLQQVGHQRVVPQVSKPDPRAFNIHGTRQEETGACRDKRAQSECVCWSEDGRLWEISALVRQEKAQEREIACIQYGFKGFHW